MTSDINNDAELIPNHAEAWNLAHFKRGSSNLARAYIDMREKLDRLAKQVELCGKESAGIFQIAAIHSCPYTGPNWVKELEAAKNVLAAVDD